MNSFPLGPPPRGSLGPSKEVHRPLFTPEKSHPHEVPRDPLGQKKLSFLLFFGLASDCLFEVGPREFGPRSAGGDLVLHHPLLAGHQLFRRLCFESRVFFLARDTGYGPAGNFSRNVGVFGSFVDGTCLGWFCREILKDLGILRRGLLKEKNRDISNDPRFWEFSP